MSSETEPDSNFDPKFCHFCQDSVPHGTMLVISDTTHETLWTTDYKICRRCGDSFDGRVLATRGEPVERAVFQFEHFDFDAERLASEIDKLSKEIEDLRCHVCDKPIKNFFRVGLPARAMAIKMLRMDPGADSLSATCTRCSELGLCPHCNGEEESE